MVQQHGKVLTWSALSTTKRARSASCWATCFASTALVNCTETSTGWSVWVEECRCSCV